MAMDAHVLGADGVLRLAHGVHDGARLVRRPGGAEGLRHLEELLLGRAADLLHHLRRVAGVVLLQMGEDAVGVVQALRLLDDRDLLLHVLLDAGGRVLLLDRDRLLFGLVLPGRACRSSSSRRRSRRRGRPGRPGP